MPPVMRALLAHGDNKVDVQDIACPAIGPGELLLKVQACGICFSDIHKIRFRKLDRPTVLGHEIAGLVVEARSERFQVGDRVVVAHHVPCLNCHFCRHGNFSMCAQFKFTQLDPGGFAEYIRVPALHAQQVAFRIPDTLSDSEASFMEPLGCCVRNVRRLNLQMHDVVVLVGLGSIGLLMMQVLQAIGVRCIGLELDAKRQQFARSLGLKEIFSAFDTTTRALLQQTPGQGADAVILTAGRPALLPETLTWLRDGGTLNTFASFHPESEVQLDWNMLYYRELNVVTTYSSSPDDLAQALAMLADGRVKVQLLAQHRYRLEDFSQALAALDQRRILKGIVIPHAR